MKNTDRHVFAALSEFSLRYLTRSLGCHFTTLHALNAGHARFTIGRIGTGARFFFPLFHRFSFASQPMSRGTENKIRRRNTYIWYITAETRWHKGGETGFQSLHLILRRRRRRRSPRRRRGRRAIADLTTRYHECSRRNAISCLMVELPRVSTPS